MKKLILTLCSLALIVPMSYAQGGNGPGDGSGGSGDGNVNAVQQQIRGDYSNVELPPELEAIKAQLEEAREPLMESRQALVNELKANGATDAEIRAALATWHVENADAIAAMKTLAEQIQAYIRENRPEREPLQFTQRMRERHQNMIQNQTQLREQRLLLENENLGEQERNQIKAQIGELLRERKHLMRNKRADEGGNGGDNGRRPGE